MAVAAEALLPARLHLVSSNERLAHALASSLSEYVGVTVNQVEEALADEDGLVVGVFDVNERAAQLKWQQLLRSVQRSFLRVECEPDSICFGPFVAPDQGGCIECLANWSRTEWSELNMRSGAEPGVLLAGFDTVVETLAPLLLDSLSGGARTGVIAVHNRSSHECVVRRFIPHPFCRLCDTRVDDTAAAAQLDLVRIPKEDSSAFRAGTAPDEETLITRFKDRRTGLVRYLFEEESSTVMPMAVASFAQDGSLTNFENGYGRSTTRGKARVIAVLEALERYAGYMPRGKRSKVRASYNVVRDDAIDPRRFILHDEAQVSEPGFKFVAYSDDLEFNWVWAYSLRRRRPVLVPEQLVYYRLPDSPTHPGNRFLYEVSNGCAMGTSLVEAALHGLFEAIERDAFLNTWYTRRAPVQLDVSDSDDPNISALLARAQTAGYDVHLFDVSSRFGVAAVWGMIVNPVADAPVKSYSAAGASIDPERAVFSALVEICTSIPVYEHKLPQQRSKAAAMLVDPSKVQTMEDHVVLYSHPESFDRFTFLFGRPGRVKLKERFSSWYVEPRGSDLCADFLDVCGSVLEEADDVIVADQSFPTLVDAGLHCVKVLAPGLTPVTFGHQYRRISLARLRQYAGPSSSPATMTDVNPFPHNFP